MAEFPSDPVTVSSDPAQEVLPAFSVVTVGKDADSKLAMKVLW